MNNFTNCNIRPYKNRVLDYSKPVLVYKNLTFKCWSIKQAGRVVAHANWLFLTTEKFKVNESTRLKGLSEGKKYVHAYIVGFLAIQQVTTKKTISDVSISYNPKVLGNFVLDYDGINFNIAPNQKINLKLHLTDNGKVLIFEEQNVLSNLPKL